MVVKKPQPPIRRSKHLCADAGYTGAPALCVIEEHGYIPHVKGRGQEATELACDPGKTARRWIVEVAHSWFNLNPAVTHSLPADFAAPKTADVG
jgi:hypothetical protein